MISILFVSNRAKICLYDKKKIKKQSPPVVKVAGGKISVNLNTFSRIGIITE